MDLRDSARFEEGIALSFLANPLREDCCQRSKAKMRERIISGKHAKYPSFTVHQYECIQSVDSCSSPERNQAIILSYLSTLYYSYYKSSILLESV